jgi:hypothetical protein
MSYRRRSRATACRWTTTDPQVRTTLGGMDIEFEGLPHAGPVTVHRADVAA